MAQFGTIVFDTRVDGSFRPDWEQELNVNRRHIPYSNVDDLQITGRSNKRITVEAVFANASDMATFRTYQDGSAKTLLLHDGSFDLCFLVGMRNPRVLVTSGQVIAQVEFERAEA